MKIYPITRTPVHDERILAFSPEYGLGHPMRWRIMPGKEVKNRTAIKYWAYLEEMLESGKIEEHTCKAAEETGESCTVTNPHIGCAPAFPAIHRNWGRGT